MPGRTHTVGAILRRQAAARGAHPLLVCDDDRLSYSDAERRSAELARGLIALGAGKGTHVGLLYPNGGEFVVAMLAATRIGAVAIPYPTFATATELRRQLAHSDTAILLATASYRGNDFRARLSDIDGTAVPLLRHVLIDSAPADAVDESLLAAMEHDVDGSDALAVIYTSGSTGAPKGVVHTHSALLEHQVNLNAVRGLTADDRLFCTSPFFWIGGFAFGLLATLVAGSTLVCSNATDAAQTLDLL